MTSRNISKYQLKKRIKREQIKLKKRFQAISDQFITEISKSILKKAYKPKRKKYRVMPSRYTFKI